MNDLRTIFFYFVFFVCGLIVGKCCNRKHDKDTFSEGWDARAEGKKRDQNPYRKDTAVHHRWNGGYLWNSRGIKWYDEMRMREREQIERIDRERKGNR